MVGLLSTLQLMIIGLHMASCFGEDSLIFFSVDNMGLEEDIISLIWGHTI